MSATGSLSGAQAADYSLSNPNESAAAVITPLPIDANVTAAGKIYDGTTTATITGESLAGVLGNDDVSLTGGVANFNTKDAGVGKIVTDAGLTLTGAQGDDYTLANPNPTTTATITPLAITGSFVAGNKIYDGTQTASIVSTALTGVILNDNVAVSGTTGTFDTKDVGNGITVTASVLTLTGPQAGDYSLSNPTETASANITPLTITASVNAANKIYDGATSANVTGRSLPGVKSGDSVTLIGGIANFNSKDVNAANTVTVTGLSLSGPQAGDYLLASSSAHTSAHISALPLTGIISAADKTYDGTTAGIIASRIVSGALFGDTVALAGGTATFDTKDVGSDKTVTAGNFTLAGAQAGDYYLANPTETAAAAITPLTISGSIAANNKIYDGTTAATLASQSLTGIFAGDAVSLVGGVATFNTPDVATANTVTATGLSLSGAQAGDYVLGNPTESAPASSTPLGIAGSVSGADKIFDGTTVATLASRTLTGVIGSDDVTMTGGAASFATSAVGNNKPVTATGLTLTGAAADDYSLTNPTETTTANIVPLAISGTVFSDSSTDGIRQNAEAGLSGRVVTLQLAGKGTKGQKTTKTDINGNFSFSNLSIGSYVVKVTPPALAQHHGLRQRRIP